MQTMHMNRVITRTALLVGLALFSVFVCLSVAVLESTDEFFQNLLLSITSWTS